MRISTTNDRDGLVFIINGMGFACSGPSRAGEATPDAVIELFSGIVVQGKQTQNVYVHLDKREVGKVVTYAVKNGLLTIQRNVRAVESVEYVVADEITAD